MEHPAKILHAGALGHGDGLQQASAGEQVPAEVVSGRLARDVCGIHRGVLAGAVLHEGFGASSEGLGGLGGHVFGIWPIS